MNSFFKRILTMPLALLSPAVATIPDDLDFEALGRMVDNRTARAERGVLRDYFAQHGVEGDDMAEAEQQYRRMRSEKQPDAQTFEQLRSRCGEAEKRARDAVIDSAARVRMARLGVDDELADDILLLARARLERDGSLSAADDGEASGLICDAVADVLGRLPRTVPGTAHDPEHEPHTQNAAARNPDAFFGSAGSFPRNNDGHASFQQQLDRMRASGDNAAAVALINAAAEKGIFLR